VKKVSENWGVTWREKSSDEKKFDLTLKRWCQDILVLIGFRMTNGVGAFGCNV